LVSKVQEVNDSNFDDLVLRADRPVLADFSASWCGPCKKLHPIVEELASEYDGRVNIVRIDVDQARETAARYGVMSVPSLFFFKDAGLAGQLTGVVPKETLKRHLDQLLS
jgi:thioredoxin 1